MSVRIVLFVEDFQGNEKEETRRIFYSSIRRDVSMPSHVSDYLMAIHIIRWQSTLLDGNHIKV